MTNPPVIAIDGPAASGKGTLARRLAHHYGLPHLDTGLTYRAVAHYLLDHGQSLDDETAALTAARAIDFSKLDRDTLAAHDIGAAASKVAVMPKLRAVLVGLQREFANTGRGAVLDGRDIGTVVCRDADVKLYVTATPQERARRRWSELRLKGSEAGFETILADIQARDERDIARADSPLKPAADAHLLDTSEMDIETAFQRAVELVEQRRAR